MVTDCKIIAQPNNSLTPKGAVRLMAVLTAITMTVGLGFTLAGAWLIMPFAGIELLAFGYAFYYMYLHSSDFESIEIAENAVVVESRSYKTSSRVEFQRYWTRVMLREVEGGQTGIFIGSHGKEQEFGRRFLDNEQRAALARELKEKLKITR
ncbi:MAG TPA: DUF2244 domain-containing protein [Methylophilus sp.]|nr:DUF2244 domain-containing protein [Methylophilus sp.]HQQ32687.1 DUF2244 domain-containing protein [Methylophilus sp.]